MKALLLFSTIILVSCGHHKDVRPSAQGNHRVVVTTHDQEDGQRDALKQANHYCEQSKKTAAIETETVKYTGDIDEDTYKKTRMVSRAAKTAGGAVWVGGAKRESNVGKMAGLGGVTTDSAIGKGYTVEMIFKCI